MTTINEYLRSVIPIQKTEFERIRKIVKEIAPEAEEVISYGIPTFKYNKQPLLYFGAFKNHMSLFPASDATIEGDPLSEYVSGSHHPYYGIPELPNWYTEEMQRLQQSKI